MIKSQVDLDPVLLNQEDAEQLLGSVSNLAVKQLMEIAYAEVKRRFEKRECLPATDFDLLFFTEATKVFFSKVDEIRRILDGEDLASEYNWEGITRGDKCGI